MGQYSSLCGGTAVLFLGVIDIGDGVPGRVQVECGREEVKRRRETGEGQTRRDRQRTFKHTSWMAWRWNEARTPDTLGGSPWAMQCDTHVIKFANCMRKMTCEVYLSYKKCGWISTSFLALMCVQNMHMNGVFDTFRNIQLIAWILTTPSARPEALFILSVLCCLFVLLSVSKWKVFVLAFHLRGTWIVQHRLCPQDPQFFFYCSRNERRHNIRMWCLKFFLCPFVNDFQHFLKLCWESSSDMHPTQRNTGSHLSLLRVFVFLWEGCVSPWGNTPHCAGAHWV